MDSHLDFTVTLVISIFLIGDEETPLFFLFTLRLDKNTKSGHFLDYRKEK